MTSFFQCGHDHPGIHGAVQGARHGPVLRVPGQLKMLKKCFIKKCFYLVGFDLTAQNSEDKQDTTRPCFLLPGD
jgi:hypothetical protein